MRFCPVSFARVITAWVCALVGAIVLSGCSGEAGNPREALRIGVDAEPKALDPHIITGLVEMNILQALFEGLVNLDPLTLEPIPGVAERWERSADGRTYTFFLNPDSRWSNGVPVTAQDFVFSWERILNPRLAAEYASILYYIENARPYNSGKLEDFSQVGVKALDPHTLEVKLEQPIPFFLSMLVHSAYMPVHADTLRAHGDVYAQDTRWTRPGNLVSNGAYQLREWRLGQYVSVEKNPHYHDAEHTRTSWIYFYPIKNQNTETRAFRSGQLHITAGVPYNRIAELIKNDDPSLRIVADLGIYYYLLNTAKPPLNDPRVRRALSLAINREQITQAIRQRGESPAYSLISPDVANYSGAPLLEEDLKRARTLLAEAGFPDGKAFPKLELLYNTSEQHRQIAVAVQDMWKRHLGIDVSLSNQSWKVYLESRREGNYAIARAGWFADYNDPMTFLEIWLSHSGLNHSRWGSERFDALIQEANRTPDKGKRSALLREAETLLLDASPLIPVFFYKRAYLIDPRVRGWEDNVMSIRPYRNVWIEEGEE